MRFRLSFHTVLALALAAVLAAGFYFGARTFIGFVSTAGADLENTALVSVAVTAAAALEADEVAKLKGPGQDTSAPAFRTVRSALRRLHDALPGVRFVYLVGRKKNGALMFLNDAEKMSSKDYSPPGQLYAEAPEKFREVFDTRTATIEGPYRDRWGEWTSSLAPIIDPASGKVLAVIGFDVPAAAWNRAVNRSRHSDILTRLRELGLRIAVDDFGTGYSSLQYLHAYPIGRIKIAQQFMREVTGKGGDAAIVTAVIELGRALKLDVVAEGVETAAQAEFLLNAGCHMVQGFYFSPPVPAAEMAAFLRRGAFAYPRKIQRRQRAA